MTAVTTNTRPQRYFSSGSNLRFGGRQSTVSMVFHALAQSRLSPRFSSTRKNKSFLQYFATGSGTASCQDQEEYEFVECLSEETQIIDLFTNCKLQPHRLSQCKFATRLNSASSGFYSCPQPSFFIFFIFYFIFMGRCDPKRRRTKLDRRGKSLRGGGELYNWGAGGG